MSIVQEIKEYLDSLHSVIEIDESVRMHHQECSDGKDPCLIITRIKQGFLYHCHRCGKSGYLPYHILSVEAQTAYIGSIAKAMEYRDQKIVEDEDTDDVSLPDDSTVQFTDDALEYLYKFGITDFEIEHYNILYSPKWCSIIFPVMQDHKLVFWQARNIISKRYINPSTTRKDIYFKKINSQYDEACVIVEDIISAIKVGRNYNSVALLHSSLKYELVRDLCQKQKVVIFWLDPDKHRYQAEQVQRFQGYGFNVRAIYSESDPKWYSDKEIADRIDGVL